MVTRLPVKQGISAPAVTDIPEQWNKSWFRTFITNFMVNADIRNAKFGPGFVVTGNVSGNSTSANTPGNQVTISQEEIPSNTVLGNVGAVEAVPSPVDSSELTDLIEDFTATSSGTAPASGGGTSNYLRADGTWSTPTSAGPITNNTVLGNVSGSTTQPVALSQAQVTALINLFTSTLSGDVPASGGGTTNYLRADGTWATPPGGSTTPGGANTQVQFNNSGAFAGSSNLTWNGTVLAVTGTVQATTLNATSDPNLKHDAEYISDSGYILDRVTGYRFKWNADNSPSMGVMSTEVKKVAPELVDKVNDHSSVNYNGLIAVLIEEVKSLRVRVAELENGTK